MPTRKLKIGEKHLLRSIYGDTLPYDDLFIGTNDANRGGEYNSITYGTVPNMSTHIWAVDFSAPTVSDTDKWIFVHEYGHVWHWYHGGSNMRSFLWLWATGKDDYEDNYAYDLSKPGSLRSFNFEQQASIIADGWFVSQGLTPKYNTGRKKGNADYQPYMAEVRGAGPGKSGTPEYMLKDTGNSRIRPL